MKNTEKNSSNDNDYKSVIKDSTNSLRKVQSLFKSESDLPDLPSISKEKPKVNSPYAKNDFDLTELSKHSLKSSSNKKLDFWNIIFFCCLSKEVKDKIKYAEIIISKYIHIDNLIKIQAKLGMVLQIMKIKDKTDEIYDVHQLDFVKDVVMEYYEEK